MTNEEPDQPAPSYEDLLAEEMLVVDVLEDLLQALDEKGLSQADLARRLGVSRSAVNRIFRGKNLTVRTVARLARAADVPVKIQIGPDRPSTALDGYLVADPQQRWRAHLPKQNVYTFARKAAA